MGEPLRTNPKSWDEVRRILQRLKDYTRTAVERLADWKSDWLSAVGSFVQNNFISFNASGYPQNSGYAFASFLDATGFPNRTDSTIGMSGSNFQCAPASTSYTVFNGGTPTVHSSAQSVAITDDLEQTYVYFNTSGQIAKSLTAWEIESRNAPCAIVYKDGSEYAVSEERHAALRDRGMHAWAHSTIGSQYQSGLAATFGNTTLSIAQGIVRDEDIKNDTGGTKTAFRRLYRKTGAGAMALTSSQTLPYAGSSSQAQYDNAGTLTNVDASKFFSSWVYATNDITYPIYVIVGQAQYATIALARNDPLPALPKMVTREWKLLYRAIFKQLASSVEYHEAADYRQVNTGPGSAYTPATHTALTERDAASSHPDSAISVDASGFTGILSGTDTTLSTALDTIDGHTHAGGVQLDEANTFTAAQTVEPGTITSDSGEVTWDTEANQNASFTMSETITDWVIQNGVAGKFVSLRLYKSGGITMTWTSTVFKNTSAIVMPTNGNVSVLSFRFKTDTVLEFIGQSPEFAEWGL